MKKRCLSNSLFASAAAATLLCFAAPANASSAPIRVTVFNANEMVAFKGTLGANATFATQNLPSGKYVVQFNSGSAALKGNHYFLAISAGKKKVIADAVAGELLIGGGAAMKVDVGPGLKITGQIVKEDAIAISGMSKYRMIDGRPYIWLAAELGTNVRGRWVDATLAPVNNIASYRTEDFRKAQDHAGEGSILGRKDYYKAAAHGY
jgi:hypothetical protein